MEEFEVLAQGIFTDDPIHVDYRPGVGKWDRGQALTRDMSNLCRGNRDSQMCKPCSSFVGASKDPEPLHLRGRDSRRYVCLARVKHSMQYGRNIFPSTPDSLISALPEILAFSNFFVTQKNRQIPAILAFLVRQLFG